MLIFSLLRSTSRVFAASRIWHSHTRLSCCIWSTDITHLLIVVNRHRSVGIVTRYGLDGPKIKSRLGRRFPHTSRPALEPNLPHVQWVPGHFRGYSDRGVALTTHLHVAPMLKKKTEVYFYSPCRSSWHVMLWILPLLCRYLLRAAVFLKCY
jgi:hypothetical protein